SFDCPVFVADARPFANETQIHKRLECFLLDHGERLSWLAAPVQMIDRLSGNQGCLTGCSHERSELRFERVHRDVPKNAGAALDANARPLLSSIEKCERRTVADRLAPRILDVRKRFACEIAERQPGFGAALGA